MEELLKTVLTCLAAVFVALILFGACISVLEDDTRPAPDISRTPTPTASKQVDDVKSPKPSKTSETAKPVESDVPTAQEGGDTDLRMYFANCDAARSAGAAPLYRGEPGYRAELDRDGDGKACDIN